MPVWLQVISALIAGLVGGAALYDRWLRYRHQITGEIDIVVLPGEVYLPGPNNWTPGRLDESVTDGIIVSATIHNNTQGPVVVQEWRIEGPPIEGGNPVARGEVIEAGRTGTAVTQFVPDWVAWDQRLEAGLTSRADPVVSASLIALSRASSKRLRLRSAKYKITDVVVRQNVVKATKISDNI
ncbi:MAG: hypothetical protein ABS75_07155 [Pelagibacterium sp. SCN 63-23]|nr:MAG: hypothetical protein ABS75_07155 [Pelagibacterium sp. SCN 63-23]